jgi:hypothetical protein
MQLHQPASRAEIEEFLQRLGDEFDLPAKLYLVAGATLVFEEIRAQTLDIEISIEVSQPALGDIYCSIRDIRDELDLSVVEVSPGEAIPLPAGYAERHMAVGRFGTIDVFHFDLYSVALSRLARGREQDYQDVVALLRMKRIAWPKLNEYYKEILPLMGLRTLKQDPFEFELNFGALETQWRSAGGNP